MKFTCFDFETANYSDASICAAGIAIFEDGVLTESRHWLIRPPKGHGFFRPNFIECHGLTWFDVCDAPEFPAIAPQLLYRREEPLGFRRPTDSRLIPRRRCEVR